LVVNAMHLLVVMLVSLLAPSAHAVTPTPDEMLARDRWVLAKLLGAELPMPEGPCLIVHANNDVVQKNARQGRPLRIGRREYPHGLFTHAHSEVEVRLPGPGATLTATVGVDTNGQTSGGRGSVEFAVRIADQEAFRSEVLREGMAPVPLSVPLEGATTFTLAVLDGGDGIASDQADWAEAEVKLQDGSVVRLADMATLDARRAAPTVALPVSFRYDGKPSSELLPTWNARRVSRELGEDREECTVTHTDPATGLEVRYVAVIYRDFPVVEWTLYLRNTGNVDTPVVEDIQALDTTFDRWGFPPAPGCEYELHHFAGTPCTPQDYEPHVTELGPGATKRIAAAGGRPTNTDLCYLNLAEPSSEGTIVGLGWPGQWAATFERDGGTQLHVRIGQELTHLKLHPGEEIRQPLVALLFWKGDWIRGQNLWRRWMVAHNLPRPGGRLPAPQLAACSSHQFGEMINANEANQKLFVDRYLEEGIRLDYWWMDAGWYPNETGWPHTGTWEVDTERFPGGLRAITDHAHQKGVRIIVWFEPERVTPGTWLYEHPDWLLGPDGGQKLLNLGNPEARQWLTDHVDQLLNEQGIDLYRQDFNMDPLDYWRANDAEDRQGITEIRHIEGYLAYWDELRRRHPNMLIDSCASGGRRNDLETLRRAVPLLRSDWLLEPVSQQGHTYGVAFWYPFWGTGMNSSDPYYFRSVMCPHMTGCYDVRRTDIDYASVRRLIDQWRSVAPEILLGDYYPLTSYSLAPDVWMAWQFDRPEVGQGLVQVFRRVDSIYEAARLRLRGLDAAATYTVTDLDRDTSTTLTGRELLDEGLPVEMRERPGAALITYRKVE
jgi:alpha-galactosidase